MAIPCVSEQVVHHIAASNDKNALLAQNCQAPANFKVKRGWLRFIDAELNNRNVGQRVDVPENRPIPVIQAPSIVEPDREGSQQFLNTAMLYLVNLSAERRLA
jgi:hypothetical protein